MAKKTVFIFSLFLVVYSVSTCKLEWFSAFSEPVTENYYQIFLPKTGQTKCYQGVTPWAEIPCAGTGQDGEYQRGVSLSGIRFRDNGNGTVTDRLTGLMWIKDGNLMASRDPGFDNDVTAGDGWVYWQSALDYVAKLNQERYLGYSDWRLPNINELGSLVNYEQENPAAWLNTQGFFNITTTSYYWTGTTCAFGNNYAFILRYDGALGNRTKTSSLMAFVLAVRGNGSGGTLSLPKTGQTGCYDTSGTEIPCAGTGQDGQYQRGVSWPHPRFRDNGNGAITDRLTGLIWVKNGNLMASRDPGFDNDGTAGDGRVTWQHALDYVAKLNEERYLGFSDLRLPNINELRSLMHYGQTNPAAWLNTQGFFDINIVTGTGYWTSSAARSDNSRAWALTAHSGIAGNWLKTDQYYVLAVRGGQ